jgi:hypothetical protein
MRLKRLTMSLATMLLVILTNALGAALCSTHKVATACYDGNLWYPPLPTEKPQTGLFYTAFGVLSPPPPIVSVGTTDLHGSKVPGLGEAGGWTHGALHNLATTVVVFSCALDIVVHRGETSAKLQSIAGYVA